MHVEGIKRMVDRQLEHGKKEEDLKKKEIESLFRERSRVHIILRGKVHGVFFRDYAKKEADKMGITGWVRNIDDGGVEIVAEGDKPCLRQFIILCEKGNPLSTVTNVDYEWEEYSGKFNDFYIKY